MNLVCIQCPRGCHLSIEEENGKYVVSGNTCIRGEKYAIAELTNPVRTLTTTVPIENSDDYKCLPVISSASLPKDKIIDCIKELKSVSVKVPVKMGDIIYPNILGLGVDIVASRSIK